MNTPFLDRQGFGKALTGISGSAIQSVYTKPVVAPNLVGENISWKYPLGDPWGWDIYPWNWGKDENDEQSTPDTGTGNHADGVIKTDKPPWYGENANNVVMLLAVVGAVLLISSKTKMLR